MTSADARSDRRIVALAALAGGSSAAEAARIAHVHERTVRRWLEDSQVKAEVTRLRGELLGRTVGLLADGATEASRRLRELLDAESEQVQLGAARAILEHAVRVRDAVDLEERLARLEATSDQEGRP